MLAALMGMGTIHAADDAKLPEKVTFSEHIAPLVFGSCTVCHRPGEAAPFALMNFADTHRHARTMLRAMTSRLMPPWLPEHGYGEFRGERRLSGRQIALFKKWVETGMAEGDATKTPKPPEFPSGWVLGKPDLTLTMERGFDVPADGPDIYQNFVLPTGLSETKYIAAVAFQATAPSVVHHILYFIDATGDARKLDGKDGKPGFPGMGFRPTGTLGGWAVGRIPNRLPEDLAYVLTKGSDVVLQTHFHPTGKAENCKLTIGLYYAPKPPPRTWVIVQVPALFSMLKGVDIPPGKADYRVEDSFTLPVDVDVVRVTPHAHYIGKVLKADAKLPDGTTKPLLYVKDWDFAWQGSYDYKQFIRLPKGTVIHGEIMWDNSPDNPRNPNVPPIRITWGEATNDEMGSVSFGVVCADEKDLPVLRAAIRRKIGAAYQEAMKNGYKIDFEKLSLPRAFFEKLSAEPPATKNKSSSIQDIDGRPQRPLTVDGDVRANVLVFLTQDCPICNGYSPELRALVNDFKDQPVRFFGIQTDPDLTLEEARKHAKAYGLNLPVIVDRTHDLVKAAGVKITPEAAVFLKDGTVAYRGRIDDRYTDLGKKRNAPTRRDLREALASILAGEPVAVPRTQAVGCSIGDVP
jgi:peroxiredoxin